MTDSIIEGIPAVVPKGSTAYKVCKDCIVTLIIPKGTRTNESRSGVVDPNYAKFRAECAYVLSIENPLTKEIYNNAVSNFSPKRLTYTVGSYAFPDSYDTDIEKVCSNGIHYFKTYDAALNHFLTRYIIWNYKMKYNYYYSGKVTNYYDNGSRGDQVVYKDGEIEEVPSGTTKIEVVPEGSTVYKACLDGIATLIIPEGTLTNESRHNVVDPECAMFRAERAYVVSITSVDNKSVDNKSIDHSVNAIYTRTKRVEYTVGNYVLPDSYDYDIKKVHSNGIHYFKTYEAAFNYYMRYKLYKRNGNNVSFTGKCKIYDDNGKHVGDAYYTNGVLYMSCGYYPDGKVKWVERYFEEKVSSRIYYNTDGTYKSIDYYTILNGVHVSSTNLDDKGKLLFDKSYNVNTKVLHSKYYSNGTLQSEYKETKKENWA